MSGDHKQWTSPGIQNELLQIMSDVVRERISKEVRASEEFGLVMDETSDISRNEQVSLCLSYVVGGERKETFIGVFGTGEPLYELLCNAALAQWIQPL